MTYTTKRGEGNSGVKGVTDIVTEGLDRVDFAILAMQSSAKDLVLCIIITDGLEEDLQLELVGNKSIKALVKKEVVEDR